MANFVLVSGRRPLLSLSELTLIEYIAPLKSWGDRQPGAATVYFRNARRASWSTSQRSVNDHLLRSIRFLGTTWCSIEGNSADIRRHWSSVTTFASPVNNCTLTILIAEREFRAIIRRYSVWRFN